MSNYSMARRLHDVLMEKNAMGMGGYRTKHYKSKSSGSKTRSKRKKSEECEVRAYKRKCKGSKSSKKNCKVHSYERKCRRGGEYEDALMELYGDGIGKSKKSKRAARHNPWIMCVKKYRKAHPGMTYREAMEEAGASYRRGKCKLL